MASEGLGEVFKGDSADMCAGKFPLVSMGGRADRQACADGERGPPSARAEIFLYLMIDVSLSETNIELRHMCVISEQLLNMHRGLSYDTMGTYY